MNKLSYARQIIKDSQANHRATPSVVDPFLSLGLEGVEGFMPSDSAGVPSLHEFYGQVGHGGRDLYAALLAGHLSAQDDRFIFFITSSLRQDAGGLYGVAIPSVFLDKCVYVHAGSVRDGLWCFEEALRSGQAACVIADVPHLDLKSSRRLQLACEQGGSFALALCGQSYGMSQASAARTRWRISGHSQQNWQIELLCGRGVRPGQWTANYDATTFSLSMVPATGQRSLHPERNVA